MEDIPPPESFTRRGGAPGVSWLSRAIADIRPLLMRDLDAFIKARQNLSALFAGQDEAAGKKLYDAIRASGQLQKLVVEAQNKVAQERTKAQADAFETAYAQFLAPLRVQLSLATNPSLQATLRIAIGNLQGAMPGLQDRYLQIQAANIAKPGEPEEKLVRGVNLAEFFQREAPALFAGVRLALPGQNVTANDVEQMVRDQVTVFANQQRLEAADHAQYSRTLNQWINNIDQLALNENLSPDVRKALESAWDDIASFTDAQREDFVRQAALARGAGTTLQANNYLLPLIGSTVKLRLAMSDRPDLAVSDDPTAMLVAVRQDAMLQGNINTLTQLHGLTGDFDLPAATAAMRANPLLTPREVAGQFRGEQAKVVAAGVKAGVAAEARASFISTAQALYPDAKPEQLAKVFDDSLKGGVDTKIALDQAEARGELGKRVPSAAAAAGAAKTAEGLAINRQAFVTQMAAAHPLATPDDIGAAFDRAKGDAKAAEIDLQARLKGRENARSVLTSFTEDRGFDPSVALDYMRDTPGATPDHAVAFARAQGEPARQKAQDEFFGTSVSLTSPGASTGLGPEFAPEQRQRAQEMVRPSNTNVGGLLTAAQRARLGALARPSFLKQGELNQPVTAAMLRSAVGGDVPGSREAQIFQSLTTVPDNSEGGATLAKTPSGAQLDLNTPMTTSALPQAAPALIATHTEEARRMAAATPIATGFMSASPEQQKHLVEPNKPVRKTKARLIV